MCTKTKPLCEKQSTGAAPMGAVPVCAPATLPPGESSDVLCQYQTLLL